MKKTTSFELTIDLLVIFADTTAHRFILISQKCIVYMFNAMKFSVQANDVIVDAHLPDSASHCTNSPIVLPHAHFHDLQHLAVLRSGDRRCDRLFPFRLEKICNRRRNRALSLAVTDTREVIIIEKKTERKKIYRRTLTG